MLFSIAYTLKSQKVTTTELKNKMITSLMIEKFEKSK